MIHVLPTVCIEPPKYQGAVRLMLAAADATADAAAAADAVAAMNTVVKRTRCGSTHRHTYTARRRWLAGHRPRHTDWAAGEMVRFALECMGLYVLGSASS